MTPRPGLRKARVGKRFWVLLGGWLAGVVLCPGAGAETVHHNLTLTLEPESHRIRVRDVVTLPRATDGTVPRSVSFLLHPDLVPRSATDGVQVGAGSPSAGGGSRHRVALPPGVATFAVVYEGEVLDPLSEEESYARGFRRTRGLVSDQGAYLSGGTLWYPRFGSGLVTFRLESEVPAGWEVISQGGRTGHVTTGGKTRIVWECPHPQDDIVVVAGPLVEYNRPAGPAVAQVFLREPDPALAERYLPVTAQYLQMYSKLLGPYPYEKFALVENFWETGYGMPSFTLLGPRVIRFPFILHSSYPHEILHNWWGNGVYVDYDRGNWAEGLTAYLADHLVQEGRGSGADYRQTTLQKYADYVSRGRDFPLTAFQARHSSASEAVGYGKSLMLYHMLRRRLGDAAFVEGLRRFYREHRFRVAGFDDLRRAFGSASGLDLADEFTQWVERAGAPRLVLGEARAWGKQGKWALVLRVQQIQPEPAFTLRVPVAVTLEGIPQAHQTVLSMEERTGEWELQLPARPLRVDVDPEYDIFRRLDPAEIPPALSGVFGAERVVVVLPSDAEEGLREGYRRLGEGWARSQPGQWQVVWDRDLDAFPPDRAVWVFGWQNQYRRVVEEEAADYGFRAGEESVTLDDVAIPREGHPVVAVGRHPARKDLTVGWLAVDRPEPLPGLGRKLPHYHKYSYLGFEGDEPANVVKGRWEVLDSPLTAYLPGEDGQVRRVEPGVLGPREPLAELPPAFSRRRLEEDLRPLSAMGGRGFGTEDLERAAEYIAAVFRRAGLEPGGEDGTYFQSWSATGGEPEVAAVQRNVIGVLPGSDLGRRGESVVVGAHYDHLGTGWPDVRAAHRGQVHPGADDNASGVAVLLELARVLAEGGPRRRPVVFAAFAGEEAGHLGSRHYVAQAPADPAQWAAGMVNLDTVGRLGDGKLLILGGGTAREWVHIFNGAGFLAGVPVEVVAGDPGGSDQVSFHEAGVPAVQLFTGPHGDYHRPSDTPDRIDVDGLARVASVAMEAVEHLAEREEPLTWTGGDASPDESTGSGRKAVLGTVPDFAYAGPGVRLAGVSPGSPAERAGLREGDVVIGLGDDELEDLKDLARGLEALAPGDTAFVTYRREGRKHSVAVSLDRR